MIEVVSLKTLLASPRYFEGMLLSTRCRWGRDETVGLKLLAENNVDLDKAAESLGRAPTTLVDRAYRTGLAVPAIWLRHAFPKRYTNSRSPTVQLQYPFIVNVRGEHKDLIAVNGLVPRGLPNHIRADVCQEIMLAILEKSTTLEELAAEPKLVRKFIRKAFGHNHEQGGFAISLDQPMRDGRHWYDVLREPEGGEKYMRIR